MSENSFPTTLPTAFPTRQAAAIEGRSRRGAVTGKLRTALDLMIWSGEKRADAAAKAGLADSSLRFAMRKPHVMAHYNAELNALRLSLRARNLHRLDTIADVSKNDMAKVGAIKVLEQIADVAQQNSGLGSPQSPGVCIIIQAAAPRAGDISPQMITIEPAPVIITP
jgi:hypothetical protein